jgi:CBS domain-containing protein
MTIARILTAKGRDVITTQPDRTLAEVAEVLVAKKIGAVVVVDDQGRIIGLLSERDIVRVLAEHGAAVFNDAVSVHMTTEVITTSEDESVYAAMEKMTNERSRHLPVVRDERLVGLVSIGDMVKHQLADCQYEHKGCENILRPVEPGGINHTLKSVPHATAPTPKRRGRWAFRLRYVPAAGRSRPSDLEPGLQDHRRLPARQLRGLPIRVENSCRIFVRDD